MLSQYLKDNTKESHQKVEGTILRKLKKISTEEDYEQFLKSFYAYFKAVETETSKYISISVLPDIHRRRNASYIKNDIDSLGGNVHSLPSAAAVPVQSTLEALSSLYVLEGSILGGPYIVQLLKKQGITRGFSFFEGYGEQSSMMWTSFINVLNDYGKESADYVLASEIANRTFLQFENVFLENPTL
ncbi:biliverdin-producing heme oxygenase [Sphingobacterium sp. HJSM2_6]|uniref:biliverdin-producing heme oxygenase n=1 Tax=Sphingobacterium sp. HJSM2_6 TaxID=3366264 RepID=UPI003BCF03AC